jgi:hypothetical protein
MSAIATFQRLSRAHEMPYGAQLASGERVRFQVWASGSDHLGDFRMPPGTVAYEGERRRMV